MILLSFGHGYSARALTKLLLPQGWRVIGTTRTAEKAEVLRGEGVEPVLWGEDLSKAIAEATHILTSAGPNADGDPVLETYGTELAQHLGDKDWVGYL